MMKKKFLVGIGIALGLAIALGFNVTMEHTSTDAYCASCHFHPHAEASWKQSPHYDSHSGVRTSCVDCHLPPKGTFRHFTAKARLGIKDVVSSIIKDSADINWEHKRILKNAERFVYDESCIKCHDNLYPVRLSDDGLIAHLYYEEKVDELDLQCINCHLDVGHYPRGTHDSFKFDIEYPNTDIYATSTVVDKFENFYEQIPGTPFGLNMIAIPGGDFVMGSPDNESFRGEDEGPQRQVTISPFFMAEIEVTWDVFLAFMRETESEARTAPEVVYANNTNPEIDAVSGPTPPYGTPDQGWGLGSNPAITMTHYSAQTFCQWLSKKTGKEYRLPTEAEWEYAARGGTSTPYFFEGSPKDFSSKGFLRKIIKADTTNINTYSVYALNSLGKSQPPKVVKPNPFGLKNMYGNVQEYCLDKYSPDAYASTSENVSDPVNLEGEEHVVRGGHYESDASDLRSAARSRTYHKDWIKSDPQMPKSIWWYTDNTNVGFRVVCKIENIN